MIARFLRNLLSIKPSEQQEVFYLFMTLLVFSIGASFARSISMTLLVENLGGEKLPLMFIFIDLSVMIGSIAYARYTKKFNGIHILGFFLVSTALFSVIAQLLCTLTTYWWSAQNWVYGFFFVGFFFFYILISIHTGSVVASYFTAVEARRVTPIINTGIPIGGALGGGILIVLLNVFHFHPQQLILVLALACLGAFWLARIINARFKPIRASNDAQSKDQAQKNPLHDLIVAFKNIISSKLMIYMSLGLMLFVIGSKLLEYHYQTIIYFQVFPDPTRRATFFATYEVFANLAWLFIQLFFTSRILVKWSVGASNVLYPVLSAIAALALFIYFYGQGLLANSVIVMLSLGIFTQFINQEMRGALRTPANNLLFNAISPNQWGNNKAFLNGIVFPLATLIAGTFLMTITGAESLIVQIDWGFSVEQLYYLLPLIALIVSILGIFIALPQWSQYEKDMQKRLEDEFVKKILGHQVNVKGGIKEIRRVIREKLNSSNTYDVIAALDMIRILKFDLFFNQVGNLLINKKTQYFKVKKHCLQTLAALSRSNSNLKNSHLNYLLEALRIEQDAPQVLSLIIKDLTKFKSVNFNHLIEKLLTHPLPSVCVEACLYLHQNPKYMHKQLIEKKIIASFDKAELSQNMPLYLYALGELRLSHYSDTVLPFLESDNPEVRLAALTAFIRLHEAELESQKARLLKVLESPDNEMKILALRALKNCKPLKYWAPVIQLLGTRDRRLIKESQELLQLNMGVCKSALIDALSSDKISVQQRFEIMLLIYHFLSNKQQQDLQKGADETLRKFVQVNGLLKFYESLGYDSKAAHILIKILQEMAEYHLDHILIVITFAAKEDRDFFQKVSNGLKSSNRANQGNALEVLSNLGKKSLVNRLLKFFDERFVTLQSVRRIYFALYGKPVKMDKNHYKAQLQALNNDMLNACLLYIRENI
ncbi:hypothetical protein PN36_11935 [Candidatus Thiomargarita nelsonii]|uniref:ADP,ATP carrier protein n=1 Tax=Candidatus Thiomargarita nelsonii TaxID=1003181 RepID=A0A0A6P3C8_9GAMM|nr:hypothetical protein PN36_11935 [Candidatus Thiomargarita nelsonii]